MAAKILEEFRKTQQVRGEHEIGVLLKPKIKRPFHDEKTLCSFFWSNELDPKF